MSALAGALGAVVVLLTVASGGHGLVLVFAVVWSGSLLGGLYSRWRWLMVYLAAYALGVAVSLAIVDAFGRLGTAGLARFVFLAWFAGCVSAVPLAMAGAGLRVLAARLRS